jgi:hypothetical protein
MEVETPDSRRILGGPFAAVHRRSMGLVPVVTDFAIGRDVAFLYLHVVGSPLDRPGDAETILDNAKRHNGNSSDHSFSGGDRRYRPNLPTEPPTPATQGRAG